MERVHSRKLVRRGLEMWHSTLIRTGMDLNVYDLPAIVELDAVARQQTKSN